MEKKIEMEQETDGKKRLRQFSDGCENSAKAMAFTMVAKEMLAPTTIRQGWAKDTGMNFIFYGYIAGKTKKAFSSARNHFYNISPRWLQSCFDQSENRPEEALETQTDRLIQTTKSTGKGLLCLGAAFGSGWIGKNFTKFLHKDAAETIETYNLHYPIEQYQAIEAGDFFGLSLKHFSIAGSSIYSACRQCCGKK